MVADGAGAPMTAQASAGLAIIFAALEQQKNGIRKFRTLDMDGTGELSAFEFKKAVRGIGTDGGGDAALSPAQWQAVVKELGGDHISIQKFLDRAFVSKVEQVRSKVKAASMTGAGMDWQKMFEDADSDGSGYLEFPEFLKMLRRVAHLPPDKVSDQDVKQMVDYMDDDRNGQIECQEFMNFLNQENITASGESTTMKFAASINKAMQKSGARMMDIFNKIDKDGSGELDEGEFLEALTMMGVKTSEAEVTLLMAAVDVDGGGTITADEFLNFLKKARGAAPERKPKKAKFSGGLSYRRWGGPGPVEGEGGVPRVTPRQSRQLGDSYAKKVVSNFRQSMPSAKWSPRTPSPLRVQMPRIGAQMQPGPSPYELLPPSASDVALRSCDMRLLHTLAAKGNRGNQGLHTAGALSLSKEELVERGMTSTFRILGQAMANNRSLYGQKIKDAKGVFETMDADKSGTLDHEEFEKACDRLGLGLTHEQVVDILELVDADNSGTIEYSEFIGILNSVYKKAAPSPSKPKKKKSKKQLKAPVIVNQSLTSYASGEDNIAVAREPSVVGVNKMLRDRALQQELSEPTAQRMALNSLEDFARESLISPAEHRRIADKYSRPTMSMRVSAKTRESLIDGWTNQQRSLSERAEVLRERQGEKVAGLRYVLQRDRHVMSQGSLMMYTASPPVTARPSTVGDSPRRGLSPKQPGAGLDIRGVPGGRCGPASRPLTAPMEFGTSSVSFGLDGVDPDTSRASQGFGISSPLSGEVDNANVEKERKVELEMAITSLRAEAAIEHGTAKGLVDQLSMLNARAVSEPDAKTSATPVPLAPPEAAEQEALVQLKKSLEAYVAEQRAIAQRTRESMQSEMARQAAGLTDVEAAGKVLDDKVTETEAAGPTRAFSSDDGGVTSAEPQA